MGDVSRLDRVGGGVWEWNFRQSQGVEPRTSGDDDDQVSTTGYVGREGCGVTGERPGRPRRRVEGFEGHGVPETCVSRVADLGREGRKDQIENQ